jgi:hypothetical protein
MSYKSRLASLVCVIRSYMLITLLGLLAVPAQAAQVSSPFAVTVNLLQAGNLNPLSASDPTLQKTVFCRSSPALAFGAIVTVVCSTGAVVDIAPPANNIPRTPVHSGGSANRYIMQGSGGGLPGIVDSYIGPGTTSSWRMVQLTDRDDLELLVGW